MVKRLQELYQIETVVEIYFEQMDSWQRGVVVAHDPPGIWVATAAGRWFVTNRQRIRLYTIAAEGETDA